MYLYSSPQDAVLGGIKHQHLLLHHDLWHASWQPPTIQTNSQGTIWLRELCNLRSDQFVILCHTSYSFMYFDLTNFSKQKFVSGNLDLHKAFNWPIMKIVPYASNALNAPIFHKKNIFCAVWRAITRIADQGGVDTDTDLSRKKIGVGSDQIK